MPARARGERYYALSTATRHGDLPPLSRDAYADEVAQRISAFVAAEAEPEIDGPVVIRNADDLPDGLMPHMKPLIEWHFAGKG